MRHWIDPYGNGSRVREVSHLHHQPGLIQLPWADGEEEETVTNEFVTLRSSLSLPAR